MRTKHKSKIIFISLFVFVGVLLPGLTFAQGATPAGQGLAKNIIELSSVVAGLVSWIWVVPATIAGKLMTNAFVYGSAFYLDVYLFKFWQIIRTFALFTLGFVFVGSLLRFWFKPNEATSKIFTLIKHTVIAGILISMSRWLIAALVDLSVIATSAVAAIPEYIYSDQWQQVAQCYAVPQSLNVKEEKTLDTNPLSNKTEYSPIDWKDIVPEGDDVSGPLMFFGMGILKFFQMSFMTQDANSSVDRSPLVIIAIIKIFLSVMFLLPLVVLMIVNIIRVAMLRLRIIFSPIIVLDNTFKGPLSTKFANYFGLQQIMALIFQPVAVVGMMGIGLILVIEVSGILATCSDTSDTDTFNTTLNNAGNVATIGGSENTIIPEVDIMASVYGLGDYVGGLVGQLILAFFVIFLLRALIKVGFSFSEITKKTSQMIFDTTERRAKVIPIIPIGGGRSVGVGAAQKAMDSKFGINAATEMRQRRQSDRINESIFGKSDTLNETEMGELLTRARGSDLKQRWSTLYNKSKEKSFTPEQIKELFTTRFKQGEGQHHMEHQGGIKLNNDYQKTDIDTLRTDPQDSIKMHKLINAIFEEDFPTGPVTSVVNKKPTTLKSGKYGGPQK